MKKIKLLIAACMLILVVDAQEVIKLYRGIPPGNLRIEDKEIFSTPASGRPTVKNVTNPTLTVYIPQKQNPAQSAVIICPGGGYLNLSIEDGGYDIAKQLNNYGITAFVLKYRTWQDSTFTSFRNIPMMDLKQAMKIVYDSAAKWKLDTTHIGLLGLSAGGHLTALAANTSTMKRPAFTGLIYPVISLMDTLTSPTSKTRRTLIGSNASLAEKIANSPELHVSANTPPAFLVHAEDDSTALVGNSLAYYKALVVQKIACQLLVYQKGGHGFALYNKTEDDYWLPVFVKWLALNGFYKNDTQLAGKN
ncbi:MAG: lipolytic protein family [Chitinophagaceae bacterium]|nr:lipolytic protein family [Chitinophagaceae bacterium]